MTCTDVFIRLWQGVAVGVGFSVGVILVALVLAMFLSKLLGLPIMPKRKKPPEPEQQGETIVIEEQVP